MGEELGKEIAYHCADIGGDKACLFATVGLVAHFVGYLSCLEFQYVDGTFLPWFVFLDHIVAVLYSTDGRSIGGGSAYTQLFKLMHKAGFVVA